ncbi:MAG: GNAT family N-acetyltransferase [Gaiellaceae bacterium]
MIVRSERPDDAPEIARVVDAAFGDIETSAFTAAIRASDGYVPELTFVAEDEGEIVGFTMLSYVRLGERQVLTLTPMAVRPDRQRSGVGKDVVRAAIAAADARGEPLLLVEGVPSYYPQFGFRSATELGIEKPHPGIPEAAWMALPLAAYDPDVRGRVVYPPFFPPPPGA